MDLLDIVKEATRRLDADVYFDESDKNTTVIDELFALVIALNIAKEDDLLGSPLFEEERSYRCYQKILEHFIELRAQRSIEIVYDKKNDFSVSSKHTKVSQNEKLERTMKNLCYSLGIRTIDMKIDSRLNTYYRPAGFMSYQSASNVILDLSIMSAGREVSITLLR